MGGQPAVAPGPHKRWRIGIGIMGRSQRRHTAANEYPLRCAVSPSAGSTLHGAGFRIGTRIGCRHRRFFEGGLNAVGINIGGRSFISPTRDRFSARGGKRLAGPRITFAEIKRSQPSALRGRRPVASSRSRHGRGGRTGMARAGYRRGDRQDRRVDRYTMTTVFERGDSGRKPVPHGAAEPYEKREARARGQRHRGGSHVVFRIGNRRRKCSATAREHLRRQPHCGRHVGQRRASVSAASSTAAQKKRRSRGYATWRC